ncbi:MAG: NAD(P)/FAD-dependent oxidoreductase [Candidatus Methylacidiphilales bacterium]
MPDRYDIIVVGAGPSGSLFSLLAARSGFRVLLLDKNFFPRPKVCGCWLDRRCWPVWRACGLEASMRSLPHQTIAGLELAADHHPARRFPFDEPLPEHRAIDRLILDDWLRQQAIAAGVVCLTQTTIRSFENRSELVTSEGTFQGGFFVGADGRNSWMARAAGLHSGRRLGSLIAWHSTLPAHHASDYLRLHFFTGGYLSLLRVSPQTAALSMVLRADTFDVPQTLADRCLGDLPPLGWKSTMPVNRAPHTAGSANVALIGDAARVRPPFASSGLYDALSHAWQLFQLLPPHPVSTARWKDMGPLWNRVLSAQDSLIKSARLSFASHLMTASRIQWLCDHPTIARRLIPR